VALEQPPRQIWEPIERLVPGIFPFFIDAIVQGAGLEAQLSSWWRSRGSNARVGGNSESQHLVALAVDLVVPDPARVVDKMNRLGLFAVDEGSHVHVQLLPAGTVAPLLEWLRV